MGRKAKFAVGTKVKKGPGRKAKKQGEPEIPTHLTGKLLLMRYISFSLLILNCYNGFPTYCRNAVDLLLFRDAPFS
jgi:hypothetical protein